jgi:hypothetical protein
VLSGQSQQAFAEDGRTLVAKVPQRRDQAHFPKDDFRIDLDTMTCTCPAGQECRTVAGGHRILVSVYHMLAEERDYAALGGNLSDERERALVQRRLVRRLEHLGLKVTVDPAQAPAPAA